MQDQDTINKEINTIDFASMDIEEVAIALQRARAEIESRRDEAVNAYRNQGMALAEALGMSFDELLQIVQNPHKRRRGARRGPEALGGRSAVAAKYRHPETGETWSGRGFTPRWLKRELEQGKSLEDFKINDVQASVDHDEESDLPMTTKVVTEAA